MAKTRQQKEEIVANLTEKFKLAKAVVFADYQGFNMQQLSDLRDKLREVKGEFSITKNTLLERALPSSPLRPRPVSTRSIRGGSEASKFPASPATRLDSVDPRRKRGKQVKSSVRDRTSSQLTGPTATLFAYDDEVSPIKILVKVFKDAGKGKVKSGFLGLTFLDETRVLQLAALPTKNELRGKTVGVLVAPLQGMVGVLQANLRNLVYALSEIHKMRGGE